MDYCGGYGEAPARGIFFEATRARWSPTAGVARPPRVCAIVVATTRQPVRGPNLVVSLYQECGVAVALRQRVPHGGGLLGAIRFVFSRIPVDTGSRLDISVTT
jgi:hypothetical protein